jgi:predicted secreted protein
MNNNKLATTLKNITSLELQLSDEKNKIQRVLDIIGLTAKFDCGFYVKEYNEDPRSQEFFTNFTLNKYLIETVYDCDYPISKSQGEEIADLFNFSDKNRAEMISVCASEEQLQEYVDYERRNSDF